MSLTSDDAGTGHKSGQERLSGLMRMMKRDRAEMHVRVGMEAADKKDWGLAVDELLRALELFEEMEDRTRAASVRNSLSLCYFALGKLKKAETESRRAARMMMEAGDPEGEATALLGLGNVLLARGDLQASERTFMKAFSIFRTQCIWDGVMRSHLGLERVALRKGDGQQAERAREEAERARRQLANGS
ncbi:MAG: tetratricopeptide repeat protein [Methanomassiliicoccales archaeon]|nr:tetratricopeptide repeat protein [Methanomassiliicoccales archaeon]